MAHRRTQIRDQVVAQLTAASIGATVSKSRVHNWQLSDLPAVSVYTLNEPVQTDAVSNRKQRRALAVVIDIHAETDGDVDDDLDALCVAVEKAMEADWRLNGLALSSFLERTTIGLSGEADDRHGLARLEYTVNYRTLPAAPDA